MFLSSISETIFSIALPWGLVIFLTFALVALIWLLVRREKALQVMNFSISNLGFQLTLELNKDEKLRILALENIALQKEIDALKGTVRKQKLQSIGLYLVFILILVYDKLKGKKSSNTKSSEEPQDQPQKHNTPQSDDDSLISKIRKHPSDKI